MLVRRDERVSVSKPRRGTVDEHMSTPVGREPRALRSRPSRSAIAQLDLGAGEDQYARGSVRTVTLVG